MARAIFSIFWAPMATYSFFRTGSLPSRIAVTFCVAAGLVLTATVKLTFLSVWSSNGAPSSFAADQLKISSAFRFSPWNKTLSSFNFVRSDEGQVVFQLLGRDEIGVAVRRRAKMVRHDFTEGPPAERTRAATPCDL